MTVPFLPKPSSEEGSELCFVQNRILKRRVADAQRRFHIIPTQTFRFQCSPPSISNFVK
jgi:hypothetical protein